jgi:hypothetical protein
LDGPGGEHWTLQTDERLSEGSVKDASGATVVDIEGSGEKWTWKHPALEGNTLVSPGGETLGAVQRSFDGAVYLPHDLDPKRAGGVAAVCVALLISGP